MDKRFRPAGICFFIVAILALINVAVAAPPSKDDKFGDNDPFHRLLKGKYEPDASKLPPLLNHTNFLDTIASDFWLVEFYSPYCIHCQMFAATWNQYYVDFHTKLSEKGINLAKVDCVVDGDLCSANEVNAYPMLYLFEGGKLKEKLNENQKTFKAITKFLEKQTGKEIGLTVQEEEADKEGDKKEETEKEGDKQEESSKKAESASAAVVSSKVVSSSSYPLKSGESTVTKPMDNKAKQAKVTPPVTTTTTTTETTSVVAVETSSNETRLFPQFPDSTEKVNEEYPKPPERVLGAEVDESLPNPYGQSVDLDHSAFIKKVTASGEPWIIKLYSPFCPHCNNMRASWDQMALAMRDQINIGEVNCEKERQLCADMKINALPSIFYLEGANQKIEYEGLRGYGDMVKFAKSMVASRNIQEVSTVKDLNTILDSTYETSIFLYFYDDATVTEDFEALSRLSLATNDIGKYYKTDSPELIKNFKISRFPALIAVSDTKQFWTEYANKGPKDMRDHNRLVDWATDAWLSVVPQMTPINARKIFDHAEYIVLAVIDPREETARDAAIREMKVTAQTHLSNTEKETRQEIEEKRIKKQLKIDEAKDRDDEDAEKSAKKIKVKASAKPLVGFAWIDGVFWERWLKGRYGQESTKNRVIVNQKAAGATRYWDEDSGKHSIDVGRSKIIDTLESILQGKQQPKLVIEGFRGYFTYIHSKIVQHLWLLIFFGCFVAYYCWNRMSLHLKRGYLKLGNAPLDVGKLD